MNNSFEFLFDLEKSLHLLSVRSDKVRLDALLSPFFFEFGSSGTVWSRDSVLSHLPEETTPVVAASYDYKATPLSDEVVLVTYISSRSSDDGVCKEFLRSSIWRKNGNAWQLEFHQGTPKLQR